MKKIGILSMQKIKNYGSFLQAYALKKMIEELGTEVEFVDYHIEKPLITSKKNQSKFSKGLESLKGCGKLGHKIKYILHKNNFSKKYFKILELEAVPNYNANVDTLVIGSDEVFNCIQANENVGYSLELFGKNNNAKKIVTYAASFGNTTIEKIQKYSKEEELSELLKKIDIISVRDNNSYNIVLKLTGNKPHKNLDPVLIYKFMEKEKIIPNLPLNEKYLILYAYSGRIKRNEAKKIHDFAKKNGLKIYSIGGVQKYADKFIDCSPFEVLAYFRDAEYIITDTFHGSIFSIINHKRFITLVRKSYGNSYGNEEKLSDLLNTLTLSERMIYDINDLEKIIYKEINYKSVEKILKIEREKTKKYLKENI